ncbi:MAG: hypothetical protein JXC85_02370 [Candidatus Aenigmarchaeota archaeon]|nr:hypothetical protein [Candidatus Aenigmarchaeota archaeon]
MFGDDNDYQNGLGDDAVSREVVYIICEQYGVDRTDVYRETDLSIDLNGSVQDLENLKTKIETLFDISLDDQPSGAGGEWETVGGVVDYVKSLVGE